ncbi:MAG: hypothetical protein NVSMB49_00430 [Ktedonobacteraceae bacterium]
MSIIVDFMETFGPLLEVVGTIFWIWMMIDCLNRAKARPQRGWLFFLLLFTHWVGALIYFFIYVYPLSRLFQSHQPPQAQPAQKQPFVYYTPPKPAPLSYQEYQQGYQSQRVPSSTPTPTNTSSQQQTLDYEEPYATYPEMPPPQQQ